MKTVGIGSLPHRSIEDAVTFSLKHDLAFLPQMTTLGEKMVTQTLSSKSLTEKYSALSFFTEKILEKKIADFKIQIAGPETCQVNDKFILNEVYQFLKYFDDFKLRPIIFIDEPVLSTKSCDLKNIFSELKNLHIISGLHSCCRFNFEYLEDLEINYLSYDLGVQPYPIQSDKILIPGIPPFSTKKFDVVGEWISSSCGLAMFSENECDEILNNLKLYK